MDKFNYAMSDHKYVFIYGDKNCADKILLLFKYLCVKNEDNVKCDDDDMCYGIVPTGKYYNEHKYKIGEFTVEEVEDNVDNYRFYRYEEFVSEYVDKYHVGETVMVRPWGTVGGIRIGKVGLLKFIHDFSDHILYTVDLSTPNDAANHLVKVDFEQIVGNYREIAETMWHHISRYSDDYPEEKEKKYSDSSHTESDDVIVWDSFYGPRIDKRWNGEWLSEKKNREKKTISADVYHYDVAWMPIVPPKEKFVTATSDKPHACS